MSVLFIISVLALFVKLDSTEQGLDKNVTSEKLLRVILKPKIVNGEPAALGDIPYQVSFKTPLSHSSSYYTFCGGSIVKPKITLSAAHCFIPTKLSFFKYCTGRLDTKHYRTTFVVAGNLNNIVRYTPKSLGQWRRIRTINFPVTYNFPIDDIAIVHLTRQFTIDQYVAPIPFSRTFKEYYGKKCLASGYGKISSTQSSTHLQKAYLQIMNMRVCNRIFGQKMRKFVCTVDRVTNVLQGDSGGPLVCYDTGDLADNGTGVLVGIVSGGAAGRGSLFTRVSSFNAYIDRGKTYPMELNTLLRNLITTIWMLNW